MQKRIRVPDELTPSSLLWTDSLSQSGRDLRSRCCNPASSDKAMLEQVRKEAEELLAWGDANGCATVLICVADRCRLAGHLDLARECCAKAKTLFCYYEDRRHRHNQAVALYALGLVCQWEGRDREAVSNYDQALDGFRRARAEWLAVRGSAQRRKRQCDAIERLIRRLRAELASGSALPQPPSSSLISLPVLSATSAGDPLCAMEEFDEWVEVEEAVAGKANFALRVDGDSMTGAGIDDGDIVLIQGTAAWPSDGQIVVVRIDEAESGSVLKRFRLYRDHICLEPANDAYPFLIIARQSQPRDSIRAVYEQRYPKRLLQFYLEDSAHCVGWYQGKA